MFVGGGSADRRHVTYAWVADQSRVTTASEHLQPPSEETQYRFRLTRYSATFDCDKRTRRRAWSRSGFPSEGTSVEASA